MSPQRDKNFREAGVAALPAIILSSLIIMELVAAGLLISYLLNLSSLGVRRANETLAAAQAGVLDAEMKITRDKDFDTSVSYCYFLSFGNDLYADVEVIKSGAVRTINSIGYIRLGGAGECYAYTGVYVGRKFLRSLRVILNIDNSTGKAELKSFKEMTI